MTDKKDSGVTLLENNGEYQLATNNKYSTQVKNFLNAELREKLTDATVEVLAIIAYRQPISKGEIEAIRGVNSQYSVRNLLMRGLIEKVSNPGDARSVYYQTTTEFLMHLGLTSTKDLPEFEKLTENIKLPQTAALTQEADAKITEPTEQQAEPASVPELDQKPIVEVFQEEQKPAPTEQVSEEKIEVADEEEEFEDDDEDDEDEEE
jgi:segregation and condensation protein B